MNKSIYLKIGLFIGAAGFIFFVLNKFPSSGNTSNDVISPKPTPVTLVPYASPTFAAIPQEIEECEKNGGDWGRWGLADKEYCQIPAKDGGIECTDGSQCSLGKCISEENKSPGVCQTYPQTFGCFSYIEGGKVASAICVD